MQKQLRLCFQVRSIISVFRAYEERHFFLAVEVNWWTVKRFHVLKVLFLKVKFLGLYCAEWSVSEFVLLMELIEFGRSRSHVWALSWNSLWFTEITQSLIFRTCVNLYTKKLINESLLTFSLFFHAKSFETSSLSPAFVRLNLLWICLEKLRWCYRLLCLLHCLANLLWFRVNQRGPCFYVKLGHFLNFIRPAVEMLWAFFVKLFLCDQLLTRDFHVWREKIRRNVGDCATVLLLKAIWVNKVFQVFDLL